MLHLPSRAKIDSIGIGLLDSRNATASGKYIDLTPGYQFLAVGENAPNKFSLAVDRFGVAINTPFLDRNHPDNQTALFVDGNVRVTGSIMASNLLIYGGTQPTLRPSAGGLWGAALPSLNAYYDDSVVIGNSNAALACTNALLITRDSWNNWNNAQVRVDNTVGAQINLGFVGHGATSPAILNTPVGVPFEFHIGRTAAAITSNYVNQLASGGVQQLATPNYSTHGSTIPHVIIDASGNVGIHTSAVQAYQTVIHSTDVHSAYASTSVTFPAALDVHGAMYASNILMFDYVSATPKELDQIFFRRSGLSIAASNVGYGDFASAPYRFPCNISVVAQNDDRYALNVGGPVAAPELYVSDLIKTGTLVATTLDTTFASVASDLLVNQKLLINGGIFVPVQAQQAIIAEREVQLAFFGSNGQWFDAVGNPSSSSNSSVIAQSVSTYDGLYYAGTTFSNVGGGVWTLPSPNGGVGGGAAMPPYEEVSVAHVASNLYADPNGNAYIAPQVPAWMASRPSTLDVFLPTVVATLTSNFVTTEYTAVNFNVTSRAMSNVNYFGNGMSTNGRFGCGIGAMDGVDNQLVSHKVDATIFGLEVSDDSDPERRLKRAFFVGHKNFAAATNPTDFGATLFVTPSMDDYRYFSPLVTSPAAVAQHMYFLPGYNFLTGSIETDAALRPALTLLGDGTNFVGINTRAPTATLHVNGDVLFTGHLKDGSSEPITFLHEVQFETATGDVATAATYRPELNGGVAHMSLFAAADSRYGLTVGTGLMADTYFTPENNRLGEVLVKDANTVAPASQGGTLVAMHALGIGTFSPSAANALEVMSARNQKTVLQVTRNGAAPDVSLDLYLSSADVWSIDADSSLNPVGGTLKLANTGTNVPSASAATLAAVSAVYTPADGAYHVGINTTNPTVYDGSAPALLVNGNATVLGDLNVTGRYLRAGQVVIDATVNESTPPPGTTSVTLGPEDVFIGGKHVYLNPQGTLYVGAVETPVVAAPNAAIQVIAPSSMLSGGSVPLAQFYTDAASGYVELGAMVAANATSRVRLEYTADVAADGTARAGTFQITSLASASFPYMTFTYKQFGATAYNNVTVNAAVSAPASKTIAQFHDTTGGGDANFTSLLVSCDSASVGGPVLTLGKVTGAELSSAWKLQGPNETFANKLGFSFVGGTTTEIMCLTNAGCLGIGTDRPAFGVDAHANNNAGATLSATATANGVASAVRLATTTGSYTWSANGVNGCLQLLQSGTSDSAQTVMQVGSNGNVSFGADAAPDPKYSLNMTGNLNIGVGGIFLNGQQLFNVGQENYVINSRLQYFIPGYGGEANPSGGVAVGVGSTCITSNLFYIQNRYDGAAAVFESDTLDAHINVYSKPPVGIFPTGRTETVLRLGLDNSGAEPGAYLGMRPHLAQAASMHVDSTGAGVERFATFTRLPSSTAVAPAYMGALAGSLVARDTLQGGAVTDGSGATLTRGIARSTAVGIGIGVADAWPAAPLHIATSNANGIAALIDCASNAGVSIHAGGRGLDVTVDADTGGALFRACGSNAMRIDSSGITFISQTAFVKPVVSSTLFADAIYSVADNGSVSVQNLDVSGSLVINGVPFTTNFWEFTAGGNAYVPGMGGGATVIGLGTGTGSAVVTVPLVLGPIPLDVAASASSVTPLFLTNATACAAGGVSDDPLDVLVLARPGSSNAATTDGYGSVAAAFAVGRWSPVGVASNAQSRTRLDVRVAGPAIDAMTGAGAVWSSGLTIVADANGATKVGVGGVVPRFTLDVSGDLNVTGSYFQAADSINLNNTVLITPGYLTLADSNVVISSRYCGIGTATGDPAVPTMPLDVYNNVGHSALARFTTSNATGVATLRAAGGAASADVTVSATGLSLAALGTTLSVGALGVGVDAGPRAQGALTVSAAQGRSAWQLIADASGGSLRVRDATQGVDRLAFDASGTATLLGYTLSSNAAADGALTLSSGGSSSNPFVYFYGASGSVGIGTAAFPFNVLTDTLAGGYNSVMGGNTDAGITATSVNAAPLRLLVNGAISCYAISSFTGQHLVAFSHPTFKPDYVGLLVSLTGRFIDDTFTVDQSTPIVEFSRKRADAAAYGVLCSCQGGSPHQFVCLVNSVGEGALWVCNVNGDIALGDFITTSSVAGYGMRQSDDLLHNFTVAKASAAVPFGRLPSWFPQKKFTFKDPFDREIKHVTACLVPCTYPCA